MKTSPASLLVFTIVVLSRSSTAEGGGLGGLGGLVPGLGSIIGGVVGGLTNLTGGLTNLTNPITSPVLGQPPAGNVSGSPGVLSNLTNIVSPITNLTNGVVGGLTPVVSNVTGGALNLTNIVGPLNNLTNGVVAGLDPVLNNVTGALNLTNIVGTLNNITSPLVDILTNLTGPPYNLSLSTNITVTATLNLPQDAASNPSIFSFPQSINIVPLGVTQLSFTVYIVQGSNPLTIPLTLKVPVLTYLNFPVSGAVQVTIDFPIGSTLRIAGFTNNIRRLFFGVSWQTFPQLNNVVITKLLPNGSQSDLYTLDIPALMCKAFTYFGNSLHIVCRDGTD